MSKGSKKRRLYITFLTEEKPRQRPQLVIGRSSNFARNMHYLPGGLLKAEPVVHDSLAYLPDRVESNQSCPRKACCRQDGHVATIHRCIISDRHCHESKNYVVFRADESPAASFFLQKLTCPSQPAHHWIPHRILFKRFRLSLLRGIRVVICQRNYYQVEVYLKGASNTLRIMTALRIS